MNDSYWERAKAVTRAVKLSEIAVARFDCPLCSGPLLIRLRKSEHGIRCIRCGGGPAHLAIASVVRQHVPDLALKDVYELSSRGPVFRFLSGSAKTLTCSEYFDQVSPGNWENGIQCQNVEDLTYDSESFDLCTSSDVFEHVANDSAGFAELCRVLRPGGRAIFTVPLTSAPETVERAAYREGKLVHLKPPEYHGDRLRGPNSVLSFRDYGTDILERLEIAGFRSAEISNEFADAFMEFGRRVIVAEK